MPGRETGSTGAARGIAQERLRNQHLHRARGRGPADVVQALGAVQAQEYAAARWGLGLRLPPGTSDADVARAFDEGHILRTHVMRPTWHFVAPADLEWMQALTGPRVLRLMASRHRELELDAPTIVAGISVVERALRDAQYLTRSELGDRLEDAGITARGPRLAHLVMCAELEAVVCSGPRRVKQFTYALVAERVPASTRMAGDEALAELVRRYFTSHGPATARDFAWWSGLTVGDAKRGLEVHRAGHQVVEGQTYWSLGPPQGRRSPTLAASPAPVVHLLPIYDEYLVAYRDRRVVPHGPGTLTTRGGETATFQHALVIGGQVAGTWKTMHSARGVGVTIVPMRRLAPAERRAAAEAVRRYGCFLAAPVSMSIG